MTEMKLNRQIYGETLVELGEKNENIVVLEADIAKSTHTNLFGAKYPDRFFNIGVQEQNEVSIAAGLATTGKIPFVSTFAMFLSMRASEQIRTSVAYPNLNVKIVATNAGVEIAGDGATHQAVEDIATMRVIPNMQVFSPSDAVTTQKLIEAIAETTSPAYVRLGRQTTPVIHDEDVPFEIGKMIKIKEGKDGTIIATGHMVAEALVAVKELEKEGLDFGLYDCHTIKPLDREAIISAAKSGKGIITIEDHHIINGLGSAVSDVITDEGIGTKVVKIGLKDLFPMSGRNYKKLLRHYGICKEEIIKQAYKLMQD